MDRRSWLWRRKSSEKISGETESSGGSISSHSERFSDDQVNLNHNSQSFEVTPKTEPPESEHNHGHGVKTLSEKLSEALVSIKAKEELVNQHVNVAEEAVSGWEKAEREVLALRQQVEVLTARNSTLEDRVLHLDGALKECLRQLRQAREEKDQITHEALEKKNSETESCLTSIDTDLYHKLDMAEKENSDLRLEISSMAEELEIRLVEKELSNQAAEQASKQHLHSIRKVVKLEAECHRLNSALQKANNHQSKAHKTPSIIENIDFKETSSFVDIGLMDDFLEMEKLVGLPETSEVDESLRKVESLEIVVNELENELKESRNRLEEVEYKLAEREIKLKASRNQLEETESKLVERENELKASRNQLKEAESKLNERENELMESRNRLEESETKLAERENELKASRNRIKEAESKLVERENELKASRNRIKETESKLAERENDFKASRNRIKETESKLAERENDFKASRNRIKEAESKLVERENELKASKHRIKESEFKLGERKNELKESRTRLEEAEFKLVEQENELKASRYQLGKAESKLAEHEIELKASRYLLEKAESKLAKTTDSVEMAEAGHKSTYVKKEEAESRCKALDSELEILVLKVESLENDVQKERDLSKKAEAKHRELKESRIRAEELRFLRVKQDTELAKAGSKFGECQKTIASLNRQLKTLATLNDLLIDTNNS